MAADPITIPLIENINKYRCVHQWIQAMLSVTAGAATIAVEQGSVTICHVAFLSCGWISCNSGSVGPLRVFEHCRYEAEL